MIVHLANDLRVLLAAMVNAIDTLRGSIPRSDEADEALAAFDKAIDNAFYVSRELIAIGAPRAPDRTIVDLNELIVQVKGILERLLAPSIRLSLRLDAVSPMVQADRSQLEWVLLNLATNGRDAMPDGGALTIETTSIDAAPQDRTSPSRHRRYVRLTVRDTGGRQARTGASAGLTGVAITSRLLNGSLHVQSNQPHGTEVHLYVPVVSAPGEDTHRNG